MESDDSDAVTYRVRVKESGDSIPLSLPLEYKDNYNKEYAEDVTVELKLLTDAELGQGTNIFSIIIILLILVVLGYFGYKKFIKR